MLGVQGYVVVLFGEQAGHWCTLSHCPLGIPESRMQVHINHTGQHNLTPRVVSPNDHHRRRY